MNIALSGMESMHCWLSFIPLLSADLFATDGFPSLLYLFISVCIFCFIILMVLFLKNLYSVDDFRHVNVISTWSI